MNTNFLNPVSAAIGLIECYHQEIRLALSQGGVPEDQLDKIMSDLVMASGPLSDAHHPQIWFSSRRPHRLAEGTLDQLAGEIGLSPRIGQIFAVINATLRMHQANAIRSIYAQRRPTVIATGTGSGKTEAFLIPLIQMCLDHQGQPGVKAIIIYPRNALAQDQDHRIQSHYLDHLEGQITVGRFTGETDMGRRSAMLNNPPDILITNHVMMERILTLARMRPLRGEGSLQAVVFDELHTFRGSTGADIAWLVRRLRAACATNPVFIGASATIHSKGGFLAEASGEGQDTLQGFLQQLFGRSPGDPVSIIFPEYEDEPMRGGRFPEPDWEHLEWTDRLDARDALFQAIFRSAVPEEDSKTTQWRQWAAAEMNLTDCPDRFDYAELIREHALIRAWRRFLNGGDGASAASWESNLPRDVLTYGELIRITEETYREWMGRNCPDAARLTRAILAALCIANHLSCGTRQPPPLFLTLHMVLRNASGSLRCSPRDGRYHLVREMADSTTGEPLFDVWSRDTRHILAGIRKGEPHRLYPLEYHPPEEPSVIVRLSPIAVHGETPTEGNRIRILPDLTEGRFLAYTPDCQGDWIVSPLDESGQRDGWRDQVIHATESRHNLDYLVLLTRQMLKNDGALPRLLIFSDGRERLANAGFVLQEEFAHRFLLGLARDLTGGRDDSLDKIHQLLKEELAEIQDMIDPFWEQLRDSIDLWLIRLCATPPRRYPEMTGLLAPIEPDCLNAIPTKVCQAALRLLHIAIEEGAVAWDELIEYRPDFRHRSLFEYDHQARTRRILLTFMEGLKPADPDVEVRALTSNQQAIYAEDIKIHGIETLREAMTLLLNYNVMISRNVLQNPMESNEDKTVQGLGYALSPRHVMLATPSENGDYDTQRDYHAVAIHSSETPREQRKQYENRFNDPQSALAVMVATSTLEVGVDFQNLRQVLCYGIPPDPAGYAQRAGRAGRSRKDAYALVVSWCNDTNAHDMFFFQRPEELRRMISGQVMPPQMDVSNPILVRGHMFAMLMQDRTGAKPPMREETRSRLSRLLTGPEGVLKEMPELLMREFRAVFGCESSMLDRIFRELIPLVRQMQACSDGQESEIWFKSGLPPRYGFPDREIALIRKVDASEAQIHASGEEQISARPAAQAVMLWYPGQPVVTAQGVMSINEGRLHRSFDLIVKDSANNSSRSDEHQSIHDYKSFVVLREEGRIGRHDSRPCFKTFTVADFREYAHQNTRGLIQWGLARECSMSLVNCGPKNPRVAEANGAQPWGIQMIGDLFLVRLMADLDFVPVRFQPCTGQDGPTYFASFFCALAHAVQEYFRVDEDELMLFDRMLDLKGNALPFIGIMDGVGRGLVSMTTMAEQFPAVLRTGLERLQRCQCAAGCYACLRTYSTQMFSPFANRQLAEKLLRHALDGERITVIPPSPPTAVDHAKEIDFYDVQIGLSGQQLFWKTISPGKGQAEGMLSGRGNRQDYHNAFIAATKSIPQGSTIRLKVNQRWFEDMLIHGHIAPDASHADKQLSREIFFSGSRYIFVSNLQEGMHA